MGFYRGAEIYSLVLSTPYVHSYSPSEYTQSVINVPYRLIRENASQYAGKVLGLLGVKYLLVDDSVDWEYEGLSPSEYYQLTLSSQDGVTFEREIGSLSIYRNEWFTPRIFATQNGVYVEGNSSLLEELILDPDFQPQTAMFFSEQLPQEQQSLFQEWASSVNQGADSIAITFQKINPTRYEVRVDAKMPFFLVFSDSYHPGWVAYVDGEEIPAKYHSVVNGYANGWYIDRTGKYDIVLEYGPQRLFETSVLISLVACAACVIYLVKDQMGRLPQRTGRRERTPSVSKKGRVTDIASILIIAFITGFVISAIIHTFVPGWLVNWIAGCAFLLGVMGVSLRIAEVAIGIRIPDIREVIRIVRYEETDTRKSVPT